MELVRGMGTEGAVQQRVLIATPCLDGNVSLEYHVSALDTLNQMSALGIALDFAFVRGDCFIAKARNNLVNQFYERKADSLFFIDADQGWDTRSFIRMVMDPREIVTAAVPKKQDEIQFNNVDLVTNDNSDCVIENGLLETRAIGSGFMRIKKSALDKMIAAYPETYIPGDGSQGSHYSLFEIKTIDGKFWGEDMVFCKKWCAIGGKIWVDPNVDFRHVGRKAWEGNFLKYLQQNCKVQVTQPLAA